MADTPSSHASSDEEIEEPKPIMLSQLPTLRYLFKNRTLARAAKERYPFRADLLDRVSLFQGDITRLQVDSIVNAANRSLLGGGGVDGAIHHAAGPGLVKECATLGGASTGEAKITGGHRLPAKHIIHAVGPVYSSMQKDIKAAQLTACYSNSLDVALDNKLKSVAFCSISTGIYGYPIYDATHIALETTRQFLEEKKADSLDRVIFVVWSDKDKGVYEELLPQYFPPVSEDVAAEAESAKEEDEAEAAAEQEPETEHTGLSQEAAELDISDAKKDDKDDKDK